VIVAALRLIEDAVLSGDWSLVNQAIGTCTTEEALAGMESISAAIRTPPSKKVERQADEPEGRG
jgi:hypothetical protein